MLEHMKHAVSELHWLLGHVKHAVSELHWLLSPFLTGRMFVRRTYFGRFDEL